MGLGLGGCLLGILVVGSLLGCDAHGVVCLHKVLHHLSSYDESCGGRHEGIAGGDVAPLGALAHILVGTNAVETAADGVVLDLLQRLLVAAHHFETGDMELAGLRITFASGSIFVRLMSQTRKAVALSFVGCSPCY